MQLQGAHIQPLVGGERYAGRGERAVRRKVPPKYFNEPFRAGKSHPLGIRGKGVRLLLGPNKRSDPPFRMSSTDHFSGDANPEKWRSSTMQPRSPRATPRSPYPSRRRRCKGRKIDRCGKRIRNGNHLQNMFRQLPTCTQGGAASQHFSITRSRPSKVTQRLRGSRFSTQVTVIQGGRFPKRARGKRRTDSSLHPQKMKFAKGREGNQGEIP